MRIALRHNRTEANERSNGMRSGETVSLQGRRPGNGRFDCPCCAKPLAARNLDGIVVAVCGDCGGIWLEAGRMPALLERGPMALAPLARESGLPVGNVEIAREAGQTLRCPRCHTPLEGGPYAYHLEARVDHCSQCSGAWVGAGELAAIVDHHARTRRHALRPRVAGVR